MTKIYALEIKLDAVNDHIEGVDSIRWTREPCPNFSIAFLLK